MKISKLCPGHGDAWRATVVISLKGRKWCSLRKVSHQHLLKYARANYRKYYWQYCTDFGVQKYQRSKRKRVEIN